MPGVEDPFRLDLPSYDDSKNNAENWRILVERFNNLPRLRVTYKKLPSNFATTSTSITSMTNFYTDFDTILPDQEIIVNITMLGSKTAGGATNGWFNCIIDENRSDSQTANDIYCPDYTVYDQRQSTVFWRFSIANPGRHRIQIRAKNTAAGANTFTWYSNDCRFYVLHLA